MNKTDLTDGLKSILVDLQRDLKEAEHFCNYPESRLAINRLDKYSEYIKAAINLIEPKPKGKYNRLEIEESLPFEDKKTFYVVGYVGSVSDVLYNTSTIEDARAYVEKNSNKPI